MLVLYLLYAYRNNVLRYTHLNYIEDVDDFKLNLNSHLTCQFHLLIPLLAAFHALKDNEVDIRDLIDLCGDFI